MAYPLVAEPKLEYRCLTPSAVLSSDVTLAHSNNKDSVLSAECESGSAQCLLCVCVCVCVYYILPPLDNSVR